MPSNTLAPRSLLLTPEGWLPAVSASDIELVVGVDRHGLGIANLVLVESAADTFQQCFVGTRAAFGCFHPRTVIVDAAGTRRRCDSIVATDASDVLSFEAPALVEALRLTSRSVALVWDALAMASVVRHDDFLLFRAASEASLREPWMQRTESYVRIDRRPFLADVERKGIVCLDHLAKCVFGSEEGALEVVRDHAAILSWIGLARLARFAYDTRQHTSTIRMTQEAYAPVEPVRTAFGAGYSAQGVVATWDDPAWSPIVSGFLLGAER